MNPIRQKIAWYYYTDGSNQINDAILRSKNKEKIFNARDTSIYLEILKRMNHIVKIIENTFDGNNPNK